MQKNIEIQKPKMEVNRTTLKLLVLLKRLKSEPGDAKSFDSIIQPYIIGTIKTIPVLKLNEALQEIKGSKHGKFTKHDCEILKKYGVMFDLRKGIFIDSNGGIRNVPSNEIPQN